MTQAAAAAAGAQQYPPATLYVVATPIGNLADLTFRAAHVLGLVDAVACEDTRVSAGLLRHLGLHKPLIALHQHNEHEGSATLITRLQQGERVAYISDAGTPAISDPGAVLVAAVARAGLRVFPVPGVSSTVTALSVAGDTQAQGFAFAGFLPTKTAERRTALQRLCGSPCSQVLFEAPHRIKALVDVLAELCPTQHVTVCRELTKQFETVYTAQAVELPAWMAADPLRERGEFVLVLHAVKAEQASDTELPAQALRALTVLAAELPLKQAVSLAAELSGAPRNKLYELALAEKKAREQGLAE
ncbi:16S rRNA (cytidine(1402)-2'-O)-methyltransferase [Roseateles koreensis]|uniref:Ribosomal RNA small subunit methyltransferase I n=1 Tax=Roseateles koreensis TaxID=2987526 RepID=A0ABT5KSW1_9BURK|nr:16S rRNA (cytidine(1402)-2'-O)-methyltransferase [Roseateles koreensis]MDC8785438.1 16S rRNA (cytidine(1402)-2'-O)-methyltransferase [Roseateles koreensis]